MSKPELKIENYNNDFLIIKSEQSDTLIGAGAAIYENNFDFVDDVIVTETEVCVKLNGLFDDSRLPELNDFNSSVSNDSKIYRLPIYFHDSEDWKQIETHTGLKKESIISKLLKTEFSIAMFGFLPGFVYLNGLEPGLHVPRKNVPSKYVKANSVAIGGKYLGIYAIDSPGGWNVIGQLPTTILNLDFIPPVELNPGDQIVLESIDKNKFDTLISDAVSFKSYNS